MKKQKAKKIKALIEEECKSRGIPFTNLYYRRAKGKYADIPRTKRHLVG